MQFESTVSAAWPTRRSGDPLLQAGLVFFLMFLLVGMHPFTVVYAAAADLTGQGDPLRRTILALELIALLPFAWTRRRQLARTAGGLWLLLAAYAWCAASVLWAYAPDISLRRLLGSLVILGILLICSTMPSRRFRNAIVFSLVAVMAANLLGVVALHDRSISAEGYWKGLHDHKNDAGAVAALAIICTLPVMRRTSLALKVIIPASFGIFLIMTGSKTSITLAFAAIVLQAVIAKYAMTPNKDVSVMAIVGAALIATAGGMVIAGNYISQFGGHAFTDRAEIWEFVWRRFLERPLTGWGYASFWGVGELAIPVREAPWVVSQYTQAHNGYLDTLVSVGVVGFVLTMAAMAQVFVPLAACRPPSAAARPSLLVGYGAVGFGLLHNAMESSFLLGLSPVWAVTLAGMVLTRKAWLEQKAEPASPYA